ncbi:MAG: TolC family protein [Spirochaetaceae bacterium]|nr:TolC family protein [Spirochaetaceae bacterium]
MKTPVPPRRLLLLIMTALLCAAAPGAEDFSLEQALELALGNNADLAAKKVALEQARREAAFSWNALWPNLSLTGGISNTHPIDPAGDGTTSWSAGIGTASTDPITFSFAASDIWSASVGVNVKPIAAVPVQMRLAAVKLLSEGETYLEAERALITEVSTGFFKLLADRENIEILRAALALSKRQYEETMQKYNRGLASELDLLNAEYDYQTAGPELDDAVKAYDASLASFLLVLGLEGDADRTPAGDIVTRLVKLPPRAELAALYTGNRGDVKRADLAVRSSELGALSAKLQAKAPTIGLSESFALSPGPAATGAAAGADPVSKGVFSLSVSIPVTPWLPFSSPALSLKAADETTALAERSLETTRKQAALDIQKKADALGQAAGKIHSARMNHTIAARAHELSQQGYEAGLVSQTDLLSARQRMVSARQAVLQAEIAYISAVYDLAGALGLRVEQIYDLYGEA